MSKATIVKITSLNADGAKAITDAGKSFIVNSFAPMNGVLKIAALMGNMTIYEFAEIISGCFHHTSTFDNVKWVTFTFNTITVTVTLGEAMSGPDYIVSKWKKAWDDEHHVKDKDEKFSTHLNDDIDD